MIENLNKEALLRDAFGLISDQISLHATAVRSITFELDEAAARYSIKVCHQLIKKLVPCKRSNAVEFATVAMISNSWPEALTLEIGELFRSYIRAGYVRINDRVDAFEAESYSCIFVPGRTALEVAIRQRHLSAACILIEEGERTNLPSVPSYSSDPVMADQFELANHLWDDPRMTAHLREAVMRRQLLVSEIHCSKLPTAAEPRRRSVGV